MKTRGAFCLLLVLLCTHIHILPSVRAQQPGWTIMVYMAADNDIESFALADLNEMEFVGSSADVNVVVQLDRSPLYDTRQDNWVGARRFLVTKDVHLDHIGSEQVADLGTINSGDPASLVDFTTWAMTAYPAEHYALVIWNHGGAWLGVATDGSADDNDINLVELERALQQITEQTRVPRLDLIGFDACLMGSLEVYEAIAPYARYAVGSPELIPGSGWDYLGMLDALNADPAMNGADLGRAVVDSFVSFYSSTDYDVFGIGLVDLDRTAQVTDALQNFAEVVGADPVTTAPIISAARGQTPLFGAFDDPRFVDFWAAVDFLQFMQLVSEQESGSEIGAAATRVLEAGAQMTLYYRASTGEDTGGMSIYFPRTLDLFGLDDHGTRYTEEAPEGLNSWQSFLRAFYSGAALAYSSDTLQGSVESITAGENAVSIALNFGSAEVSQAAVLIVLEIGRGVEIVVDYSNQTDIEDNRLSWGGQIPWLTDGHARTPVLVLPSRSPNRGVVNGLFYPQNGKAVEAQLLFDLTTNRAISIWGMRQTASSIMPFEIQPEPGDIFQPFWLSPGLDNQGLIPIPATTQFAFSEDPFELIWLSAPTGSYHMIVLLENGAGNVNQEEWLTTLTTGDDGFALTTLDSANPDMDGDFVPNDLDNCAGFYNPGQLDTDGDGLGDACDPFGEAFETDPDADGVMGGDNCPALYNPDQMDEDGDGTGNACETASTGDTCSLVYDPDPIDLNGNGISDSCETVTDTDQDGAPDAQDNCPTAANPDQADLDSDGVGDVCDTTSQEPVKEPGGKDSDGDGILDSADNCPAVSNPDQLDADNDSVGDACDVAYPSIPPILITSLNRMGASPTSAATVTYNLSFSQPIADISSSNFMVDTVGLSGVGITGISGDGLSFTVTVSTGIGNGTLTLLLIDGKNAAGQTIENAPYTGETYAIDKTPPSVASIVRADTTPTTAGSVRYNVTFSEPISGLTASHFSLTTTGVSGAAITELSGSGSTYTVTANSGTGDGILRLDMVDAAGIVDQVGFSISNVPFTAGETYTIDKTAPVVSSITRANASPTHATSVNFTVTFSEPVLGLTPAHFSLATTGVSGAAITGLSGSGNTYTVTANSGSGDGTLRLDMDDATDVVDLVGFSVSNIPFTAGESYTIDKTPPQITAITRQDTNPTNAGTVRYGFRFTEDVTGVNTSYFSLTTTGTITGAVVSDITIWSVTPGVMNYDVHVSTGTGSGTIQLNMPSTAGIIDYAGNPVGNVPDTSGAIYTIDKTPPQITFFGHGGPYVDPTNAGTVTCEITFSESITGLSPANFAVVTSGSLTGTSVSNVSGSGTTYTITTNTGTGSGALYVQMINSSGVRDATGNVVSNVPFSGPVHNIDRTGPTAEIARRTTSPTNASLVQYRVIFSELLAATPATSDFGLTVSGLTGASVYSVNFVSDTTYIVFVDTGSLAEQGSVNLIVTNGSGGIRDALGNTMTAVPYSNAAEAFAIDRIPPTITAWEPSPNTVSNGYSVPFIPSFSEAVQGVNLTEAHYELSVTGTFTTAPHITGITDIATVTINTGYSASGGTIYVSMNNAGGITDMAGNPVVTPVQSSLLYTTP